jgi:hypothetical protein
MNLEDLCAYIMQPEMKKTKKKQKKKRKDGITTGIANESAEERSTSVDTTHLGVSMAAAASQKDSKPGNSAAPATRSASTAPTKSSNMFTAGSQGASDRAGSLSQSSVAESAAAGLPEEAVLTQNFSDE